jgi:hypothetical protein
LIIYRSIVRSIIRRLALLLVLIATVSPGRAPAQASFPAPLPGQTGDAANPPAAAVPSLPFTTPGTPFSGNDASVSSTPENCARDLVPLREEAERRGKLIKAAGDRHAPPDEACRLIGDFERAEIKMIQHVEAHAATCGISDQISRQLKAGHENTTRLLQKVCALAQKGAPAGPTGDFNWFHDIPADRDHDPARPPGKG